MSTYALVMVFTRLVGQQQDSCCHHGCSCAPSNDSCSAAGADSAHLTLHVSTRWQVQSKAGAWQPVMLKANQLAVFAGETLQHATAGRIPAAVHRVFLDPATNQTGVRQMYILPIAHPSALCRGMSVIRTPYQLQKMRSDP
jgi:hypothetical protein